MFVDIKLHFRTVAFISETLNKIYSNLSKDLKWRCEHRVLMIFCWMNEWGIYITLLLCIAVHPKHFTVMWGWGWGSLLNHHQCAASTWMISNGSCFISPSDPDKRAFIRLELLLGESFSWTIIKCTFQSFSFCVSFYAKSHCERQPSCWCFVRMNLLFVFWSLSANEVKKSVNKASGGVFLSLTFSFFNEGLLSGSTNHANEQTSSEENAIKSQH